MQSKKNDKNLEKNIRIINFKGTNEPRNLLKNNKKHKYDRHCNFNNCLFVHDYINVKLTKTLNIL